MLYSDIISFKLRILNPPIVERNKSFSFYFIFLLSICFFNKFIKDFICIAVSLILLNLLYLIFSQNPLFLNIENEFVFIDLLRAYEIIG